MRKLVIAVMALPVVILLGVSAFVVVRANHSLAAARSQFAVQSRLDFEFRPYSKAENAGFEVVAPPSGYTSGSLFQGKLYLAGPGGLAEFTSLDAAPRIFRTGIDLPPGPVVALSVGTLRGDSHASLILATHGEGLLFYDGSVLRQLRPRLKDARDITAVLPLPSGDLLLGTRKLGVLVFSGKTLTPFQSKLTGLSITTMAGDDGDLWIGTRANGVLHWHAGQLDMFDASSGLPDQQVECIAIAAHKVYVGTPLGVAEFNGLEPAHPARILAQGFFAHALTTDGATLIVASIDQGIREFPLIEHRVPHSNSAEAVQVESFFSDPTSVFAVTANGLARREPSGGWQPVFTRGPSPLADSNIAALNFASDGRLWIGYFDRGLDVLALSNTGPASVEHVEDDHVFCVNRIVTDPLRHTVDVATANGLVLFDTNGHQRQTLLRRDGLIADQVTDVAFTSGGTVLATPAGLTFIDSSGTHSLYSFQGLVNNHIYALATNPANSALLAGTLGGISYLNDGVVHQNLTTANSGLKQNWITGIVPVSEGTQEKWFLGTYGAGVMQLDATGQITGMDGATRPSEINPNAMLVTARHVFAGSLSDGLFVYNRATSHWSTISAGLPSLNVTALAQHDGQLYIGTDNGVVHIDESRLPQ